MKPRARWVAAVAIAVAVITIGWTIRHTLPSSGRMRIAIPANTAEPAPESYAQIDAKSAKAHASQAVAIAHPAHALPDSNTPLGEAVRTLREYAEAGDSDAAIDLSWRLSFCTEHALKVSEQGEQTLRDSVESDKADASVPDDFRVSRAENAQRQIDEAIKQREACRALPSDLRADWLSWIDRAAQAGNSVAMRGYARMAAAEYYSASDVLADLDTAIERRDKARAYLQDALRLGDAEALRDIANAHRDSGKPEIYPFDPAQAYAYAYAGTLAGISRGNDLDEVLSETARSLDGRQLADAEARGRGIDEKCCEKH